MPGGNGKKWGVGRNTLCGRINPAVGCVFSMVRAIAVAVIPPASDSVTGINRTVVSCSDRDDKKWGVGGNTICGRIESAMVIIPPTLDRVVGLERAGVVVSGGNGRILAWWWMVILRVAGIRINAGF